MGWVQRCYRKWQTVGMGACVLMAGLLGGVCPPTAKAQTNVIANGLVFGYATGWVPAEQTIASLPYIDRLMFMELRIGRDGKLANPHGWPGKWSALRQAAAARGLPVDVALTQFEASAFNAVFSSAKRVRELEAEVLRVAADELVSGIHLDVEIIEPVAPAAAKRYREFVASLGRQLKAMQPLRLLSVFYFQGGDRQLYDASTMNVFDHVVVQGYDSHWLDSAVAGPVSPLTGKDLVTWERMLATMQAMGVSLPRIVFGFPTFGYEWQVEPCTPRGTRVRPGRVMTFGRVELPLAPQVQGNVIDRVLAHGARYDDESGSAFYQFRQADGGCTVGWFEDWWTLQRKVDWVRQHGLAGLAAFPLGYENGELVGYVSRRLRTQPLPEPATPRAQ